MNKINIGPIIAQKRREKGITQEELAEYLGVSKPAVSKWESGQSYPDILLLPLIAAYFGISTDSLLGYEAWLTPEEIKKLYLRLSGRFADEAFDKVYEECEEAIKHYHSCWPLLFSMAQLLINHAPLAGPERTVEIFTEASGLFEQVEKASDDVVLARQALSMRAYCLLALNKPAEAIDLLSGVEELPVSSDALLIKAYTMHGESGKAKDKLQAYLYRSLLSLFGEMPDMMALYADEPARVEDILRRTEALGDVFGLKAMHPALYFTLYITAAGLFIAQKQDDRALDMLEKYVELLDQKNVFPLKLRGNEFFDRLEPYIGGFNLGDSAPRSDKLIRRDIKNVILQNPTFQPLTKNPRYRLIEHRLNNFEEE